MTPELSISPEGDPWDGDQFESPDDEPCEHEGMGIDWEGRWHCESCGYRALATSDEIKQFEEWQREVAENFDQYIRYETNRFYRAWRWVKARWVRLWHPHRILAEIDDEIPF